MVQVVGQSPNFAQLLGTGISSGVESGLQNLIKLKMDEILGQKEYQTLTSLLGKPVQQPNNISAGESGESIGQPQQQTQPQAGSLPAQGFIKPGKAVEYAKFGAEQEYRQKKLESEERKQKFAEQEKRAPYLHAKALDFGNAKRIYNIANEMKKLLVENKDIWPELSGLAPDALQKFIQRHPAVRKYMAKGNELVTSLAASRKGQTTNFKLRQEQLSKPELSMPHETQLELLDNILDTQKMEFDVQKEINRAKESGEYPQDLETRITEFELRQLEKGQNENLPDPNLYLPNTVIDINGKEYELKNNKWILQE